MAKDGDKEIVAVNTAVKKTGRGGKYNFPSTQPPEDAEDVRAALTSVMAWYEIGKTKAVTDKEWEDRTTLFFDTCIQNGQRPTWEKYCLCMGYTRQAIWEFLQGNHGASRARIDVIKKAKEYCAAYDAEMVQRGKLRDAPYIFRAINYYGLKQQQDIVIEPKQSISDVSADEIAAKYQELPD